MGKRICIGLEGDLWLVMHLMIAGRLHWKERGVKLARPRGLAAFDFPNGTLLWTEAGSQKRASLHVVAGEENLRALDPGGLEVLEASAEQFAAVLNPANHTLKRALTDPRLFSGIGNAYSDEILWKAQLSPMQLTQKLKDDEVNRLYEAARSTLTKWVAQLRNEAGEAFPEKVTAFQKKWPCTANTSNRARVRQSDPANSLRGERSQLLPTLSDRRQAARRSGLVTPFARRLAQNAGRAGDDGRAAAKQMTSGSAPCAPIFQPIPAPGTRHLWGGVPLKIESFPAEKNLKCAELFITLIH